MFKKIEFGRGYIKVEYQTKEETVKIFNKMNTWNIVEIDENVLTYRFEKPHHLFLQLKEFLIWSTNEMYSYKKHLVDTGKVTTWLDLTVNDGYLFKVSLKKVNKFGEKYFSSDFGIWQFGRMLSIHDNDTINFSDENPVTLSLKNSNVEHLIHKIEYDEKNIVTIEMVKIEGI